MEEELMRMKRTVVQLHNTILDLSAGLWDMNAQLDELLLNEMGIKPAHDMSTDGPYGEDGGPCEVTHTAPEPEAYTPQADQPARVRGRPRKEPLPEPPEPPRRAEPQKEARKPAVEPEVMPQAIETPKKRGIVEQLLGKDASDKAKLRAERLAQLEKEMAELKGGKR